MAATLALLVFSYAFFAVCSLAPLWAVRTVMQDPAFPADGAKRVGGWVVWLMAAAVAIAVVFVPLPWLGQQLGKSSIEAVAVLFGAATGGLASYRIGPIFKRVATALLVKPADSKVAGNQ